VTGLPTWISATLAGKLDHVSRGELRERAQAISEAYRAGGASTIIRDDLDALAYAVARLPATYAAVRAALGYVMEIIQDFQPQSILDVGAGPGTASWAAIDAWPSVQRTTLVDSNPQLLALARQFQDAMQRNIAADIVADDLAQALGDAPAADVVMASYALTELSPAALNGVLGTLWQHAERLLVIVEPGTVDGFRRILSCRDTLIASGATIVAPCSHQGPCPLVDTARWCHFAARLARSRDHMIVKDAHVPFEDEKFSYLVAGKGFADMARGGRVLATPKVSKAGVGLTLCAPEHAEERNVARRDRDAYKAAKRLDWGDLTDV
jgi:ribosomal protein RSM22 (predicted rRNA methylase)